MCAYMHKRIDVLKRCQIYIYICYTNGTDKHPFLYTSNPLCATMRDGIWRPIYMSNLVTSMKFIPFQSISYLHELADVDPCSGIGSPSWHAP